MAARPRLLYLINRDCMGVVQFTRKSYSTARASLPWDLQGGEQEGCSEMHIHATPVYWDAPDGPSVYTVCEQILTGGGLKIIHDQWW